MEEIDRGGGGEDISGLDDRGSEEEILQPLSTLYKVESHYLGSMGPSGFHYFVNVRNFETSLLALR